MDNVIRLPPRARPRPVETAFDRLAAHYAPLSPDVRVGLDRQEEDEMKPIPTDPSALQARVFGALCEDLFDLGAGKARTFRRVDTLREIRRQTNEAEKVEGAA